MRKIFTLIVLGHFAILSQAQSDLADSSRWNVEVDFNSYFFVDDFIFVPVIKADKNKLHLETRYNYEDRKTFSGWVGYNFSGGKKLEYLITPMIGGVTGNSKGIAGGLELTLTFDKFELYSETEYFMGSKSNESNFAYMWTDLTYSISDRLWAGLSTQRTKLYQTNLDLQRGLLLGTGWKRFEATGYMYNMGFDTAFFLVTLTAHL